MLIDHPILERFRVPSCQNKVRIGKFKHFSFASMKKIILSRPLSFLSKKYWKTKTLTQEAACEKYNEEMEGKCHGSVFNPRPYQSCGLKKNTVINMTMNDIIMRIGDEHQLSILA